MSDIGTIFRRLAARAPTVYATEKDKPPAEKDPLVVRLFKIRATLRFDWGADSHTYRLVQDSKLLGLMWVNTMLVVGIKISSALAAPIPIAIGATEIRGDDIFVTLHSMVTYRVRDASIYNLNLTRNLPHRLDVEFAEYVDHELANMFPIDFESIVSLGMLPANM